MIGSLRGELDAMRPLGDAAVEVVLEVGGVGYRVIVGARTAAHLAGQSGPVALRVHTHVRESAIALYGFSSDEELRAFEVLLGAHGVGPALALSVLGVLDPGELATAVVAGDVDTLSRVPGVGRKTAARLVVDLAARMESFALAPPVSAAAAAAPGRQAVVAALESLGYGQDEVRAALENLPAEGTLEELLRAALATLAPVR